MPDSDAVRIRAYIAALPPEARRHLKQLRDAVRSAAPEASDGFSYRIPGLRLDGRPLLWYAGFKQHSSLYPIGPATIRAAGVKPGRYETSKGTIRFPHEKPIPVSLVKRLVKARIAELRRDRLRGRR